MLWTNSTGKEIYQISYQKWWLKLKGLFNLLDKNIYTQNPKLIKKQNWIAKENEGLFLQMSEIWWFLRSWYLSTFIKISSETKL